MKSKAMVTCGFDCNNPVRELVGAAFRATPRGNGAQLRSECSTVLLWAGLFGLVSIIGPFLLAVILISHSYFAMEETHDNHHRYQGA